MFERRLTRKIRIGNIYIGGDSPVAIQSMNNTLTTEVKGTLDQIEKMAMAGCDITRVAIPDMESAAALSEIVRYSPIPVVADIHFDYKLALAAIENGAAKIRINPGNIGGRDRVEAVASAAKAAKIPIRVGVNSGSVNRNYLAEYGSTDGRALTRSALDALGELEEIGFEDIVLSVKSSDPLLTIKVYRLLSEQTDYPMHLGVTEAGTPREGIIRSAVGIGTLLAEGIGDTIRVSLTGDPVQEVETAVSILKSLGLRQKGVSIISCPTCGRTEVNLIELAGRAEDLFKDIDIPLKIAVMGCAVNGPGEARDADAGIAGGKGEYVLFKKGVIVGKVPQENAMAKLREIVMELVDECK